MEALDAILDGFTNPATGSLHGAVFLAADKSGQIIYQKASGRAGFGHNAKPLQLDSLFWIASMTKVVTAVAVVQLVERGVLSLDEDVRERIPELRDIQILQGMERDASGRDVPKLGPIKGKLTLRHFLSHSSGLVYDGAPLLQRWSEAQERTAHTFSGSMAGYTHPQLFQPGTSWGYGPGLDWAGQLIERVTGLTLEQYMHANIWSKLGAHSTTFHPELRAETLPPLMEMGNRVSENQGEESIQPGNIILGLPLQDDLGGIGLFSTPMDFMKFLITLLRGGDALLSKASVGLLFQPQLSDESRIAMPKPLGAQMRRVLGIRSVDDHTQADHCLGGTITLKDIPERRRAGSINWSGLPNLHWWIDPKTGITAALFTQLMPPGDGAVTGLFIELEKALYRVINGEGRGGVKL
ncbi:beta-lactamase/transpeptidase-like protein [Aspergillus egyptiacus]|nr:beta-lactamase/transpeptidase-like protein [Aspergillus egyptiacus]